MPLRTTSELVAGIIEVDVTIPLDPFIEAASALVDEVCVDGYVVLFDVPYSDTKLELIERWLSAHFYAVRDPRAKSESVGPISETKESDTGLNLLSSKYGQMAMTLDTRGGLAALNQAIIKGTRGRKVGVSWLGTPPATRLLEDFP